MNLVMTVKSVAKLNLFLHVTGRRGNGYHELQTVFQLIDLHDSLTFTVPEDAPSGSLALHSAQPDLPLDDNLVLRAAALLREHCAMPQASADIQLVKRIPMGAGLGGGSSNAAATLKALNSLWQCGLDTEQLCRLGLRLGADVPLFIKGRTSWGSGVGEVLVPIELPAAVFLVIWPGVTVSTAEIFSHPELTRNSPTIRIADFLAGSCRNDCEMVVRKLYPQVDQALNWLSQFGPARMTGTGSSVFAKFSDSSEAQALLTRLPKSYQGFVVKSLNHSL